MTTRGTVWVGLGAVALGGWWVTASAADRPVARSEKPAVAAVSAQTPDGGSAGRFELGDYHARVVETVSDLLARYHFTGHRMDDEMSARWFDEYVQTLDPNRDIFLQSDIDEFSTHREELDDYARSHPPKLDLAQHMYEVYQTRQRARADHAIQVLSKPLDLTNPERLVVDREKANLGWPATEEEANEIWRKRVENDVIGNLLDGRDTEAEVRERLSSRYQRWVKDEADKESIDLLEDYLRALGRAFDPHTEWFAPAKDDQFDISITNSVEGIGASLKQDDQGYTIVEDVIPGGPAFKDGRLREEDRIFAVAQARAEPVDVVGMRLDKVVALIRGAKGTEVQLHVEHPDGTREVVDIIRDRVLLEDSAADGHVEEIGGKRLGVVNLPSFYIDPEGRRVGHGASDDVAREINELTAQNIDGMLLDLRSNGGGSLNEAIEVAGLFLPGGPVVQVRFRDGQVETLSDQDTGVAWGGPLVVMVDAFSASASEIVAGALQDYGRAVIVGDRATHGKGSVQQVIDLDAGGRSPRMAGEFAATGSLKVTVQKFYRVSGGSTQIKGVESDVVLPSPYDLYEDIHESGLDWPLPWDQIPPAPHVRTGAPSAAIPGLVERSQARVAKDEDFEELRASIPIREKLEAEQDVSLVLEERRAEYEQRKAALGFEDDEQDWSKLTSEERKALRRKLDYRLNEGLAVLADYVGDAAK